MIFTAVCVDTDYKATLSPYSIHGSGQDMAGYGGMSEMSGIGPDTLARARSSARAAPVVAGAKEIL